MYGKIFISGSSKIIYLHECMVCLGCCAVMAVKTSYNKLGAQAQGEGTFSFFLCCAYASVALVHTSCIYACVVRLNQAY